jgi:hypothetical protein
MRRSTVILVVLFAALGLLYWYVQQPGNVVKQSLATSTTTAQPLSDLLRPDQGPVSQIVVQSADGKTVTLKKSGGIWLVATDHEAPANQESAEMIAQGVLSLKTVAKLEKAPDLATIGLSKPAYTISMVLLDGSPYTFKVGNATVTGSGYYTQMSDGSIVVVDKHAIDSLINIIAEPPFLQTATPEPAPVSETPIPDVTPTKTP